MNSTRAESILGIPYRRDRWATVVTITTEQAKQLLEAQPLQRPVRQAHVDKLAREMKAGRFVQTNEALAFDEEGLLFDGQHRLWACFLSSVPITVLVCFNEPRRNFDLIGHIVQKRSMGDLLIIGGDAADPENAKYVASVAQWIWAYDAGKNPVNGSTYPGWNADELRAVLTRHPSIWQMCATLKSKRRALVPGILLISVATLASENHEDRWAVFQHQLLTGEGLVSGDPALTLRERAINRSSPGQRAFTIEISYALVRAWNAFYAGRRLGKVYGSSTPNTEKLRLGGMDPFPPIAGYDRRLP